MKTSSNNNNIESINGMSQVIIDMSPKTRMYKGHGRETLTEVYYRVDVTAYTANLYTYTEQAREESKKACVAYYSEVVALLESEGWERQNDKYDDCPTMTKGTQQLRCHPQEIVGNVLGEDVERLAEKLKGMTSCKWIGVDVYSNCVITTSAEDTMQLYRQTWDSEIMDIMAEMFRTKRTTMYYKLEARLHNVADRIRIKINDWRNGKVDYEHDEDVMDFDGVRLGCDYVVNVYLREWARRAISEGRLIVTENADGIKIARWVNKKEEKERAKAIREAEKAEKERKAQEWQEFLDREAEKQNSFAEGMRVKVPAASLERNRDKEAFVITRIRRKAADNGGNASLTVKSELTGMEKDINGSDVSEILPALQEASEITEQREQNDTCISSAESRRDKANGQIKDDSFFTKGKKYRCIKSVVMKKGGKTAFKAGKVYEQVGEPSHWVGWLRNEQGDRHGWPQPVYIADEVKTWGTRPEDIDPRLYFEPVEDVKEADFSDTLDDDLKAGDRVLSRHYGAQATVLGKEWDKQRKAWYYRVQFDTMQRHMDGSEFNVTEFHRDGLTKNYDPATGRERVGNAEYYRENLLAEFWGNDRTPRTVYGMEIFKPTDRRPSWLVVADIFSEPKEMTLREVCDMLAARYQEEQGKAA